MKFADLKTSEELHGLLVGLGVKVPESEFCWYEKGEYIPVDTNNTKGNVKYKPHLFKALSGYNRRLQSFAEIICPAYSFDEIWEMLPDELLIGGRCFYKICESFKMGYYDLERTQNGVAMNMAVELLNHPLAQAATKLLIWVIKNHKEEFIQNMEAKNE